MKDRIVKIMQIKNLNATQFAEVLEIQRSGISHIISGRNKPSLDLIIKIKESFPEFSLDWLIFGRGPATESQPETQTARRGTKEPDLFDTDDTSVFKTESISEVQKTADTNDKGDVEAKKPEMYGDTDTSGYLALTGIEKIVFFYKNGRFKVYGP
jgi:transcriptional regulator with XRE-family HTH domain